jgi:plastocyanin
MRHATSIFAIVMFFLGNIVALAADKVIEQRGKTFSETEVVIKKGDALTFVNNDNITHNVMSKTPGNEFNIGAQTPGTSVPVKFDSAGSASIICAIHPQMRMNVQITN